MLARILMILLCAASGCLYAIDDATARTAPVANGRASTPKTLLNGLDASIVCPYWHRTLTQGHLNQILREHEAWIEQYKDDLWGLRLSQLNGRPELKDARRAKLCGAILRGLDFSNRDLSWADLSRTNLSRANLQEITMQGGTLAQANLWRADLTHAGLSRVDFNEAFLYIEPGQLPNIASLSTSENLDKVRLCSDPRGEKEICMFVSAGLLQNQFRQYGMRKQEREITAAIKRWEAKTSHLIVRTISWALFEWTSGYGVHPFRPLLYVVFLLVSCTPVYALAISGLANQPSEPQNMLPMLSGVITAAVLAIILLALSNFLGVRTFDLWSALGWLGVWIIGSGIYWVGIRSGKSDSNVIEFYIGDTAPKDQQWRHFSSGTQEAPGIWRIWTSGFYFSLVTALRIGWRDLNAGTWITAMHPRRLRLRALGWIRVVAGFQSVASVYFIALWALTYFGRPFE